MLSYKLLNALVHFCTKLAAMRLLVLSAYLLLITACSQQRQITALSGVQPFGYRINKKIEAKDGVVVSAHPLASQVGVAVMKQGGNAVDAAIATQWALAVVYPNAGNIGGGGFMVAQMADGKTLALDYREAAPAAAHRDMYLDAQGTVVAGKSLYSPSSSGVPGTVAGLFASLPHAKLSMKQLIQPAIELAQKGFAISEREAKSLNGLQETLRKYNTIPNAFMRPQPWAVGDTLKQPELAATLIRIRDGGEAGFYEGETARLIAEEMKRGGGYVTADDLKKYSAKWRTPHRFTYKGYEIVGMPMPSSGGLLLHQMMKMVEAYPLAKWGYNSAEAVQLMVEAERRAFADRAQYMGDADFVPVPVDKLTSASYLKTRMADFKPGVAGSSTVTKPGDVAKKESEETTHLSVVDKWGNAVSVTTTLNNSYGSGTVVGGAGFFLNDEMDDFSVKPGVPNMYGAVGGEANAITAGKRMLSSMTPTLVLQNGKPYLIVGTPGGTTIPTSVFQTVLNVIEFNLPADGAVYGPKFHHQWLPDEVMVEKTFPQAVRQQLQAMGYKITERGAIGRTEVIKILPDGTRQGVADNRGDDAAEGY